MDKENRRKFAILSFALVVVMLGFGMVIPIFPFYIEDLGAGGSELGLLVAVSALLEFIFGPFWGGVSDRIGRKPVLSIGMVGYALSTFLFGISTQLWMLFVARAISGILSSATVTAAMAYVSDTTSRDDRGGGMGKLGAAMAFGVILGPGVGGWLASGSLSLPFFIASGMAVVSLLLILIFLPESLPEDNRYDSEKVKTIRPKDLWWALFSEIGVLLLMVMLFSFALTNFEAVFGLYALEKFNYGPEQVGVILMVIAVVSTVGKATLTGPTTKRWGEAKVIKVSLLAGSVGFLVLLAANTYTTILLATGIFVLSKTLLRPASFALISKQAAVGHGAVMGLSNSFMSLGRIIGPIWAGFIFDVNINYPYLSGSLFMMLGFFISLFWVKQQRGKVLSTISSKEEGQ
jgi:DHA1 family multidrug resistance protein-like MFS transporter